MKYHIHIGAKPLLNNTFLQTIPRLRREELLPTLIRAQRRIDKICYMANEEIFHQPVEASNDKQARQLAVAMLVSFAVMRPQDKPILPDGKPFGEVAGLIRNFLSGMTFDVAALYPSPSLH